ncbi:MAG: Rrf2 family transcriptional regulator [Candidatus Omnitrophica bacterium]|nr:Rrf2 family transcriptional regulator [Candidatus Omnitrophota bacterium]MCM8793246.1 Rrf2 family transcriptional regulator [Candidatus Omnitrophota bacterium]
MRISTKIDYACRALLELSLNWPRKEPVSVSTIARKQHIPLKYLEQILLQLKSIGFVESIRGKAGGYRLSLSPAQISLGELMRKIGGPILSLTHNSRDKNSVFISIWRETEKNIAELLDNLDFEKIAQRVKGSPLVYQI